MKQRTGSDDHKSTANPLPNLLLSLLLLAGVLPTAAAQALCLSQFALANQACGFIGPRDADVETQNIYVIDSNHRRRHHRRQQHRRHKDAGDSACCRRLGGIDDACICQMMSRMPIFITRPKHNITIVPGDGCEVTYECGGFK